MQGTKLKIYFLTFICLSLFLPISKAWAPDGDTEMPGPRLLIDPPVGIIVESLEVQVQMRGITFEYILRNESDTDWENRFDLSVIPVCFMGLGAWYQNRSFRDLKVKVDNSPIELSRETRAFLNGVDITGELEKWGLDPNLVNLEEKILFWEKTAENRANYYSLIKAGLIENIDEKEADLFMIEPRWMTANTYYWQQIIKAGTSSKIIYSYKPLPGILQYKIGEKAIYSPILSDCHVCKFNQTGNLMAEACASWEKMVALLPAPPPTYKTYNILWFTLDLTSPKWKNPVEKFKLQVELLENVDDFKWFPAAQEGLAASACVAGAGYMGRPGFVLERKDITFDKPVVVMGMAKYN